MIIDRRINTLAKPSGAGQSVNWGHPLWHRTRGMWMFNLPYAGPRGYDLVTRCGIDRTLNTASEAISRIGTGVGLVTAARLVLNEIRGIPLTGGAASQRSLAQGGKFMSEDSITIVLIRRKQSRTGGTVGPIGMHVSTAANRVGCNMTGNGVFNWQFGGTTEDVSSITATGAWFPDGDTQYLSFSTITLGANSSLAGWYFLAGATNNYNPIFGKDGSNEIYFGSGAASGTVAVFKSGSTIAQSTGTVTANRWQHLLITDNGSAIKIYLDGADIGNSIGYTTMSGMQLTRLNQGVNSNNFKGRMIQQAIWSAALSSGDATTLYNGGQGIQSDTGVSPFSSNLVALWDGTTTDLSGNGHTLTRNNACSRGPSLLGKDFDALGTDLQFLAYTAGKRGMAIYANGRKVGSITGATTRTDVDSEFMLNENANSGGEDSEFYFAAVLDAEWTEDQAMEWYVNPWSGINQSKRLGLLGTSAVPATGKPSTYYSRLMGG